MPAFGCSSLYNFGAVAKPRMTGKEVKILSVLKTLLRPEYGKLSFLEIARLLCLWPPKYDE